MRVTVSFEFDSQKAKTMLPLGFYSLIGKTKNMTDEQLILEACRACVPYGLHGARIESEVSK